MTVQLRNGKGFEWAVAFELSTFLGVNIVDSAHSRNAETHYGQLSSSKKAHFKKAAKAAVAHILEMEQTKLANHRPATVRIAGDSEGSAGDVRDVILVSDTAVILGISCKSNHAAFKHSRLSGTIDWVKAWGLSDKGASEKYWEVVKPLFAELQTIKVDSGNTARWDEISDKSFEYYEPALLSFTNELLRLNSGSDAQQVSSELARYVIGTKDFYKVIVRSREVKIMAFNYNGTLAVRRSKLPTAILSIDRREGGRHSVNVRFDKGYTLNFRIHNASSRVEASLKFDIQAKSLPSEEIYQHHITL